MTINTENKHNVPKQNDKYRKAVSSPYPAVFTNIFQDDVNLAIWQKKLSDELFNCAERLLIHQPNFKAVITVTPENCYQQLVDLIDTASKEDALCQHIALLVDMFCTLFNLKGAGLRLMALDRPMCPKFHVDKIPCRLVSTLIGRTTQWLKNEEIDRTKLAAGSNGLTDECSGLIKNINDIYQLSTGDVALLKGEGWFDNENAGLVHRSPNIEPNERRLLLTLDFIN